MSAFSLSTPFGATLPGGGAVVAPWVRGSGSYTFTAPEAGLYTVRLWGAGGVGINGNSSNAACPTTGGTGAYTRKAVRLAKGQQIAVTVGKGGAVTGGYNSPGESGGNTTAALPSGTLTAGGGQGGFFDLSAPPITPATGGVASGGDVNINGNPGNTQLNGAGSAANGPGSYGGAGGANRPFGPGAPGAPGDEICPGGNGQDGRGQGFTALAYPTGPGVGGGSSDGYWATGGSTRGQDGLAVITYEGS